MSRKPALLPQAAQAFPIISQQAFGLAPLWCPTPASGTQSIAAAWEETWLQVQRAKGINTKERYKSGHLEGGKNKGKKKVKYAAVKAK